MIASVKIIDEFTRVAPFGVCFHDSATGLRINDGLEVTVCPALAGVLNKKQFALPNRSGVYVLQRIALPENFSYGSGDAIFWRNNPPQKTHTVKVFDIESRFVPFQFTAVLPVQGLYKWESIPPGSPNRTSLSVPLYSSATRKVAGGTSVVRAQLVEIDDAPASWAVLEAYFSGELVARGIADREGKVALIFPSLPPQTHPFASPPENATRVALGEQKWVLNFIVKYQPDIFQNSPPSQIQNDVFEQVVPDLRLALAQAEGSLWNDRTKTDVFDSAILEFGKELILRSRETELLSPMSIGITTLSSNLFVSPAI
jgi:hypothetical protein